MSGGVGQLSGVALECRDPAALADFYSRLTGWPVVHAHADWYSVGESENAGFHLSFQRSPGHQPPTWPDPASSMQLHLHFRVDDLEAAERAVLALGGTMFDETISRATAPESTPIRQVIRSALSRPEIAPSSGEVDGHVMIAGRGSTAVASRIVTSHRVASIVRWQPRRRIRSRLCGYRRTVVCRISRSHPRGLAGSLTRSTPQEVR